MKLLKKIYAGVLSLILIISLIAVSPITASANVKYEGKTNRYYTAFSYTGVKNKGDMWYAKINGRTLEVYGSFMYGNPSVDPSEGKDPQGGKLKYKKHYFKLAKNYMIQTASEEATKSTFNKKFKKRKKAYVPKDDNYDFSALTFYTDSNKQVTSLLVIPVG